jgi:NADPH-dependent 2,4-dienoyl-CoA reductase/sulfur reductase-like enzyme
MSDTSLEEYLAIARSGLKAVAGTPKRVAVIGAGIAGLVAAHSPQGHG